MTLTVPQQAGKKRAMNAIHSGKPIEFLGTPGSPYSRKMLALLRYRRIPHAVHWSSRNAPEGYPAPKVRLLPTFFFSTDDGGLEAVVDSTPIIRRLEAEYEGRSVLPEDPVLGFFNYLIEDFGDEWLTKAMFHYRWAHAADAANAGPQLIFWAEPTMENDAAAMAAQAISQRQIDRLYVVGSNATTAATIEASYLRVLSAMDGVIQRNGYVLGARPSSADFALYGQLTQLAIVEPTSARECAQRTPRARAWLDRMEDLSGIAPQAAQWMARDTLREGLAPMLQEIGRVYAPFLLANAQAAMSGKDTFETIIDGRTWTQPTFPYQAKCLKWIRDAFSELSPADADVVRDVVAGTGVESILPALNSTSK
jgi:glutathione S-transferase